MRHAIVLIAIAALISCQPAEESAEASAPEENTATAEVMDAPTVAPDHYTVEFENDHVRVLRIGYAAGEETPMHSHPDGVIVSFAGSQTEMTLPDGTTQVREGEAGNVQWSPAESHAVKALTDISVVFVELKDGGGDVGVAEPDSVVVSPDQYKVALDNERVRALKIDYAAGDESPMHSHPAGVLVFLQDGNGEMTLPDGTVQERPGEAGNVMWGDQETHGVKALTDVSVVLVELKGS